MILDLCMYVFLDVHSASSDLHKINKFGGI